MAHHTATNPQMKVAIAQAIDKAPLATLEAVRARLRGELTCAVCRELLCEPVAFDCAHMFCATCTNTLTASNGGFLACPLCRKNVSTVAPAQAIGAVLVAVFGEEYAQELRERAKNELVLTELEKLRAEAAADARRLAGPVRVSVRVADDGGTEVFRHTTSQAKLMHLVYVASQAVLSAVLICSLAWRFSSFKAW